MLKTSQTTGLCLEYCAAPWDCDKEARQLTTSNLQTSRHMKAIFTSKKVNGRRIEHWKRSERAQSIFTMGWNVAMTHHAVAANVLWTCLLISILALKVSRLTGEATQAMVVAEGLCWGFSFIAKCIATDSLACARNMDGTVWWQPVCVLQVAITIS